jgi:hypothetical protein
MGGHHHCKVQQKNRGQNLTEIYCIVKQFVLSKNVTYNKQAKPEIFWNLE